MFARNRNAAYPLVRPASGAALQKASQSET